MSLYSSNHETIRREQRRFQRHTLYVWLLGVLLPFLIVYVIAPR